MRSFSSSRPAMRSRPFNRSIGKPPTVAGGRGSYPDQSLFSTLFVSGPSWSFSHAGRPTGAAAGQHNGLPEEVRFLRLWQRMEASRPYRRRGYGAAGKRTTLSRRSPSNACCSAVYASLLSSFQGNMVARDNMATGQPQLLGKRCSLP